MADAGGISRITNTMGERGYSEDRLLRLVSLLYDTVGDPNGWDAVLDELVPLTGSDNASLQHYNKRQQRQELAVSRNLDQAAIEAFDRYYSGINVWVEEGMPRGFYEPGTIVLSHEIIPDREFMRTEFGADFAAPNDTFYSLGMTIAEDDHYSAMFSTQRGRHRPKYGDEDRRLFEQLVPHFQRVLELHNLVAEHHQTRQALQATLDCLPVGVLLVTHTARIRFANHAARQVLSDRDGLLSRRDYLVGANSNQTRALEQCIASAVATTAGWGLDPGGALALARPSGLRPLSVLVTPLPQGEFRGRLGEPLAGVFVSDPERPATALQEAMRELYGLTPAEARLAAVLMEGYELPEAAKALGIAYETARNQLKRVLTKTGAHHQGELLRMLLSGPSVIGDRTITDREES